MGPYTVTISVCVCMYVGVGVGVGLCAWVCRGCGGVFAIAWQSKILFHKERGDSPGKVPLCVCMCMCFQCVYVP